MSRCTAMAYTNDPANLVIRCELDADHKGSHAGKKELAVSKERKETLAEAFNVLAEGFNKAFQCIDGIAQTFAPPRNLPHDPALRKDRRKWGGR